MERVHVVDVSKRKLEKKDAPAISNKPLDTDPCWSQQGCKNKTFWSKEMVMLSLNVQPNYTDIIILATYVISLCACNTCNLNFWFYVNQMAWEAEQWVFNWNLRSSNMSSLDSIPKIIRVPMLCRCNWKREPISISSPSLLFWAGRRLLVM